VTAAQGPVKRRLILAAVGLGCVAVVGVALWVVSGYAGSHRSATSGDTQVRATVQASASCQGKDNNDTVSFTVDSVVHFAKLDGCGYQRGETMKVLVPPTFNGNTVLEMADAAPGDSSGLSHRVAFLLLVLATAVGGGCGYQIFRIRSGATGQRTGRSITGRSIKEVGPVKFARPSTGPRFGATVDDRPSGRLAVDRSQARSPIRLASRFRSGSADRDEVYPGETRARKNDPDATGVDWFEDSSTTMRPVDRPVDLGDRAE
jgi:hypothetical protein